MFLYTKRYDRGLIITCPGANLSHELKAKKLCPHIYLGMFNLMFVPGLRLCVHVNVV